MLGAFCSPVKFFDRVFFCVKFHAKFEVVLQKQFLLIVGLSLDIRLFYHKLSSRNSLNTATIKEVNLKEIKSVQFLLKIEQQETHRIMCNYIAMLQRAKQTVSTSKNSIEFTTCDD